MVHCSSAAVIEPPQDQKDAAGMDVDTRQPEGAEALAVAAAAQPGTDKANRKAKMVTRYR